MDNCNTTDLPLSVLDSLFCAFQEAVFIVDSQRRVVYLNAAAQQWGQHHPIKIGATLPAYDFSENANAVLDLSTFQFEHILPQELPGALLAMHDAGDKILVAGKETALDWQNQHYYLLTLSNIQERLQSEALQKALFQISEAAATTPDLFTFFEYVHQIVASLIPAPNLYIALYDQNTEYISFPYYVDQRDYLAPQQQQLRARDRKVRRGLTEYLLHRAEPLLITGEMLQELTRDGEIVVVGSLPLEWLGIPLKTVAGDIVGGIVIQTYTEGVRYTERDREILNFVSTQIAIATTRKQLEEELRQERELFTMGAVVVFKLLVEEHKKISTVYVSPNINQFGYEPAQFLSGEISYRDMIHSDDRANSFKYKTLNFTDEHAFHGEEYRICTRQGEVRWVYDFTYIRKLKADALVEYNFYILDITARKEAEAALHLANEDLEERVRQRTAQLSDSQSFLQLVIDTIPVPVYIKDKEGIYRGCNRNYESFTGIARENLIGRSTFEIWQPEDAQRYTDADVSLYQQKGSQTYESQVADSSGNLREVVFYKATYSTAGDDAAGLVGVLLDITERKRFEQLQHTLFMISEAASTTGDLEAFYAFVHGVVNQLIPAKNFYIALYDAETNVVNFPYFVDEYSPYPPPRKKGNGITELVIRSGKSELILEGDHEELSRRTGIQPTGKPARQWLGVPLQTEEGKIIGVLAVQTYNENDPAYTKNHQELLEFVSTQIALAIERKRTQEALRYLNMELEAKVATRTRQLNEQLVELKQRERELTSVVDLAQALRSTHKREEIYGIVERYMMEALDADGASLALWDAQNQELTFGQGAGLFEIQSGLCLPAGVGAAGWVIQNSSVYLNNNLHKDPGPTLLKIINGAQAILIAPMIVDDQVIGVLEAGANRPWAEEDVRVLVALAEIAAYAIQRELLSEQKENQLQRLNTLREIDRMITGNFDLQNIMAFLLGQICNQLKVDAADILLASEQSSVISFGHGSGFYQPITRESLTAVQPGPAERVMVNSEMVIIPNIKQSTQWKEFFQALRLEGFTSYYGVPLKAKGQVLGVLEVFNRHIKQENADWHEFLYALAQQTAIAIENTQLVDKLQKANREMLYAYDRTIEGWARALEIRDKITGEHSQTVTQWTLILAQAMGIRSADELNAN